MSYIVIALLSATFGFMVATLICASGRADSEAELFRLYEVIKQHREIENEQRNQQ